MSDFRVLSCKKKFKFVFVFEFAVDSGVQRGGKLGFTRCLGGGGVSTRLR